MDGGFLLSCPSLPSWKNMKVLLSLWPFIPWLFTVIKMAELTIFCRHECLQNKEERKAAAKEGKGLCVEIINEMWK